MANKKRVKITDKNLNYEKDMDHLFNDDDIDEKDSKKEEEQPKEIRLKKLEKIQNYYKEKQGGSQYTIYIPEEFQTIVKTKAVLNKESVSSFYKNLLMNTFTEQELREAYNRAYDERNKINNNSNDA